MSIMRNSTASRAQQEGMFKVLTNSGKYHNRALPSTAAAAPALPAALPQVSLLYMYVHVVLGLLFFFFFFFFFLLLFPRVIIHFIGNCIPVFQKVPDVILTFCWLIGVELSNNSRNCNNNNTSRCSSVWLYKGDKLYCHF